MLVSKELENASTDATTKEDLQLIREEVLRCQEVLQQMSADAGAATGELAQDVTLEVLVAETLGHSQRFEPVTLELLVPGATVANVARHQIAQVIRRLLGNARDATGPGTPITLRIDRTENALDISVIDTGEGMDADTLRRATEPFFTTKPEGSGTGLGLFFVRSVLDHTGGELERDSPPGSGPRATLHLPGALK